MRIVTWNCNLNFKVKFDAILPLKPDVLVIQECERLSKNYFPNTEYTWVGRNEKKGLGVLLFDGAGSISPVYNEQLIEFLPINTDLGQFLAVWAFNHRAKKYGEDVRGHILHALEEYELFLSDIRTVGVFGDFNNSVVWDKPKSRLSFRTTIEKFETFGLYSAYHKQNAEQFGKETQATLFHTKNPAKPYHVDYMFTRQSVSVEVGAYDDWIEFSDHMPLTVNLK